MRTKFDIYVFIVTGTSLKVVFFNSMNNIFIPGGTKQQKKQT
jgi:hypothetical protein